MQFDQAIFLALFPVVYLAYLGLARRPQNLLLLVASYVFYGWAEPRFVVLLAASTVIDYVAALGIAAARRQGRRGRPWMCLSLAGNLGMLGFFKYWDFFLGSVSAALARLGIAVPDLVLGIALPAGISFYTFQTLGYVIDVYRGQQKPCRDPLDFALFVSFFPQLVAGPIERARHLLPQLEAPRRITRAGLAEGAWLFAWGFFKKVYIADNLASYVAAYADPAAAPFGLDVLFYGEVLLLHLYADFSGYSDMAVGLGKLLGIELPRNFRQPLFATGPSDFWRRWHITLGRWFRDYVHAFTRGTGDAPGWRRVLALLPTMALVGLWHGASVNFLVWGLIWGAAMAIERLTVPALGRLGDRLGIPGGLRRAAGILGTTLFVTGAIQFFGRSTEAAFRAVAIIGRGLDASPHLGTDLWTVAWLVLPLVVLDLVAELTTRPIPLTWPRPWRWALYAAILLLLAAGGVPYDREFYYFRF